MCRLTYTISQLFTLFQSVHARNSRFSSDSRFSSTFLTLLDFKFLFEINLTCKLGQISKSNFDLFHVENLVEIKWKIRFSKFPDFEIFEFVTQYHKTWLMMWCHFGDMCQLCDIVACLLDYTYPNPEVRTYSTSPYSGWVILEIPKNSQNSSTFTG